MEVRLIPTSQLSPHLAQLNLLINDAFDQQDRSKLELGTGPLFRGKRIKSHDQLLLELGSEGIIAVAFDVTPGEDASTPQPVAVAALKPWKGKVVDLWNAQLVASAGEGGGEILAVDGEKATQTSCKVNLLHNLKPNNWEIATCASMKDSRYRGQGLITQCIDALVDQLKHSQRDIGHDYEPITLWVSVLEGVGNVEYWQRRGFERYGEPDEAPPGVWTASRPFNIGTLWKAVT